VAIRHIAFDLDGTLIDTRDQIIESVLACLPQTDRTSQTRKRIKSQVGGSPLAILKAFGVRGLDRYWKNHARLSAHSKLFFDDTPAVLNELCRRGISISVITSLPARPANMLIETSGLGRLFSLTDTFASRPYRKPSPQLITAHLRDFQVDCGDAAYVGDAIGDVRMAIGAGVHAWAVGWSAVPSKDLIGAGAERILKSVREILAIA
jgi:phosphoglycolate phosphatase-like HAD superfamily hydrolase